MAKIVSIDVRVGKRRMKLHAKEMKGLMRGIGLMLKGRNTSNLIFNFREPKRVAITSLFVFFPFLAIWTDKKGNILETRLVKPFTFSITPKKNSSKLLEIPLSAKNAQIVRKILRSSQ